MKLRTLVTASALTVMMVLAGTSTAQAQSCQPGISAAFAGPHGAQYTALATILVAVNNLITTQLGAVVDEPTYQTLLTTANAVAAAAGATGRLVITLPDGTVVIDTNRADGPGNPQNNTFANFQAKTINENHNSRVAIFVAQEYPCGFGVETKFSSSTGLDETYVAQRAGPHLDSEGTARLSTRQ